MRGMCCRSAPEGPVRPDARTDAADSADGPGERGAGTALVLALVAALCLGLVAILAVTQAAAAAGRAATASDLAALAAADAARGLTTGDPCAVAAQTAARNGALLILCQRTGPTGDIVDIRTRVEPAAGWGWMERLGVRAEGRSRAGPPPQPWRPPAS